MGIFGKKKRDDEYVVTLKDGTVMTIYACRLNFDPDENVVWFYSTSMNILPMKIDADRIVGIESNGKVVSVPIMVVGAVAGGMAGAAIYHLLKGTFVCNIKNALLAKAFMAVFVAGTVYIVAMTVANECVDQTEDMWDKLKYIGGKAKDAINKRFNKD
jgi:hypothetical protein